MLYTMHSSAYKRDSKDEVMRKILHGNSPYKHLDRQTHYLHNVQRELDARQSKKAYSAHREEIIERHRIMGMLSNERMDPGSRENLERRKKKLEDLGSHITNKIN